MFGFSLVSKAWTRAAMCGEETNIAITKEVFPVELRFRMKNGKLHLDSTTVQLNTRDVKKEQESRRGLLIQYRLDVTKRK